MKAQHSSPLGEAYAEIDRLRGECSAYREALKRIAAGERGTMDIADEALAKFPQGRYVTATGRVLTDEDIEKLSDEAERGYDIGHLLRPT